MTEKITISVQVDPQIYEYVKTTAKVEGRSMSNWLLQLILQRRSPQRELPFFGQPKQIAPELAGPGGVGE